MIFLSPDRLWLLLGVLGLLVAYVRGAVRAPAARGAVTQRCRCWREWRPDPVGAATCPRRCSC